MKTLAKPSEKLVTEISFNQSYRQNRPESPSFQYIKFHSKWKFLLIAMSFFIFVVISESPELDAEICNRFHNEDICRVW